MDRKLPLYELYINEADDTGVNFVALVDDPAIKKGWKAFKNGQKFVADADRHIISGPLMIADMPIYRCDKDKGEYYAKFSAATIQKIVEKYFRSGFTSNVNKMHESDQQVRGVYMFESIIIDPSRGINTPTGFDELPQGSWFGSFKVENQDVWENFVKTGEFTGFSVEGLFYEKLDHEHDIRETAAGLLNRINEILASVTE